MSSEDEINVLHGGSARLPNSKARVPPRKQVSSGKPGSNALDTNKTSKSVETAQEISEDDDEIVALDKPPNANPTTSKLPSKLATSSSATTIKGNDKTTRKQKSNKKPTASEEGTGVVGHPMNTDESGPVPPTWQHSNSAGSTSKSHSSTNTIYRKELERWKQRVQNLESQRDALSQQLDELFQVRKTEPEKALEELHVQYEERAKTQDSLIKELTSQLSRIEPLARTGQNPALHFLTREAADEEKRAMERDMACLHDVIGQKDATIDERNKRITELEQLVHDVTRERDAEVARSMELLARTGPKLAPVSSRSHRQFGLEDPKITEVIKFYEDMSSLLVTNVKFDNVAGSDEQEVIFHCIYTYYEMTRGEDDIEGERLNEKSIDFTMRIFNGYGGPNGEPMSDDDFVHRRIKYSPLHLDKEPESFVKGLAYMGDSFTFPCSQQGLFLNSLRDRMIDAMKGAESEDDTEIQE
ncbi:hypothetical protein J3A83DRAFT_4413426 [Scleroderma citrinum]